MYKRSYFLEPFTRSKRKIKVKLDLRNYATKSELKNTTGADAFELAKRTDLDNLKSDIGKLETTPADLMELSNVVEKEVVKNTVYDELVKKIGAIQTSDTSDSVKKAGYKTKIGKT